MDKKWDYHSVQDTRQVDAPPGTLIDEYNQDVLVIGAIVWIVLFLGAIIVVVVS